MTFPRARALWIALAVAAGGCQSSDATARPSEATIGTAARTRQNVPHTAKRLECRIARIADGDSVQCETIGRVRLLLVDAPELSQGAPGRDARKTLLDLMPIGSQVTIETDARERDTFERILGYVYLEDGRMVNEEMARSGYVTALVYPPNVRYEARIRAAVKEAHDAKRGLWATEFFECSPRDYRAGKCGMNTR